MEHMTELGLHHRMSNRSHAMLGIDLLAASISPVLLFRIFTSHHGQRCVQCTEANADDNADTVAVTASRGVGVSALVARAALRMKHVSSSQ